jgi:hypothetical protein
MIRAMLATVALALGLLAQVKQSDSLGFWCAGEPGPDGLGPYCAWIERLCETQYAPAPDVVCTFRKNVVELRAWHVVYEEWMTWQFPDFSRCNSHRKHLTKPNEKDVKKVSKCTLVRGRVYSHPKKQSRRLL